MILLGAGTAHAKTIQNPGFENGVNGWTEIDSSGDGVAISAVERSGDNSIKLEDDGDHRVFQEVNVVRNTDYEISVYIRGRGELRVDAGSSSETATADSGSDYERVSVTIDSRNNTRLRVTLDQPDNSDEVARFDDVAIEVSGGGSDGGGNDGNDRGDSNTDVAIEFSTSSNRSNSRELDGADTDDDIFVFVAPEDNVDQVRYSIDGNFVKTENVAPFDLQGGPRAGANPFDTDDLSDGSHTLTADIVFNDGSTDSISARFDVGDGGNNDGGNNDGGGNDNNGGNTPDAEIVFSTSSNRSNTRELDGADTSNNIFVLANPASEIDQVRYFIDGDFVKEENVAPFDLQGGPSSAANPFDTDNLSNGDHRLTANILFNNGSTDSINADFEVDNGGGGGGGGGSNDDGGNTGDFGLNPNRPPQDNFDLLQWALDTPAGRPGDSDRAERIDEDEYDDISSDSRQFFFTHTDGGMRFVTRLDGATTSSGTRFVRSELREMLRRGNKSISTTGVNGNNWALGYQPSGNDWGGRNGVLRATLRVNKVTTTGSGIHPGRTIIGQIHADDDEPLRLYYRKLPNDQHGCIYVSHEIRNGDDIDFDIIGEEDCDDPSNGIELNELFSYEIINDDEDIRVVIRRGDRDGSVIGQTTIDMDNLDSGYDRSDEWMYFKAGAYTQNDTGNDSDGDIITFYRLSATHD